MKKILLACAIATGVSVATAGAAEAADRSSGQRGGNHGNWSGQQRNWSGQQRNWSGQHRNWTGDRGSWGGNRGHFSRGDWSGGRHWDRGSRGDRHHHGFRGFASLSVWPWYWWGPSYAYGYPAYGYPAYTYYDAPAYYDSTEVYVEREGAAPSSQARYYCPDSGYYPSVQACPRGWLRVVPNGEPPR